MVDSKNLDIIHLRGLIGALSMDMDLCKSGNLDNGLLEADRERFVGALETITKYVKNATIMDLPTQHPDITVERIGA